MNQIDIARFFVSKISTQTFQFRWRTSSGRYFGFWLHFLSCSARRVEPDLDSALGAPQLSFYIYS